MNLPRFPVTIATVGVLLASPLHAAPATPGPAIAGIVAAFARHPVVAIAEAHQIRQAGDFYTALVRDPDFQRTVDDVVIEFASGQSQALLDRYVVDGAVVPPESLRTIWRNTTKAASWECPVYARWLAAIREVNRSRPPGHRLRVLAGDTPLDWSRLHTRADWDALGSNDVSFARVIEDEVLARGRHALVVLGSNHLAHGGALRGDTPNTTTRVDARHPGATFVVLMFAGWPGGDTTEARIAREGWPTPGLLPLAGSWIGAMPVGSGTPLERRADALLYLGPARQLEQEKPLHAEIATFDVDQTDRRSAIEWGDSTRARSFLGLGAVKEYALASHEYGSTRRLWVYTPPGYAASGPECDLLFVFDGGVYLEDIPLPAMLDSLVAAKRLRPTVAVMLDDSSGTARIADLGNQERFARMIAGEIVPWARKHWKLTTDPHRSTVTGSSAGGLASAFVALRHPELFGNVLSQSGAFWRGAAGSNGAPFEWVAAQYAASPKRDLRFFLDVGSTETRGAIGGTAPSILEANRHLRDVLAAKGYDVAYAEVPGGVHAPASWRLRLPAGLLRLSGLAPSP